GPNSRYHAAHATAHAAAISAKIDNSDRPHQYPTTARPPSCARHTHTSSATAVATRKSENENCRICSPTNNSGLAPPTAHRRGTTDVAPLAVATAIAPSRPSTTAPVSRK